jgi:hypothetical protein
MRCARKRTRSRASRPGLEPAEGEEAEIRVAAVVLPVEDRPQKDGRLDLDYLVSYPADQPIGVVLDGRLGATSIPSVGPSRSRGMAARIS